MKGFSLDQIYSDICSILGPVDGVSFDTVKIKTTEALAIQIRLNGYTIRRYFNLAELNYSLPKCFNHMRDYFSLWSLWIIKIAKEFRDEIIKLEEGK